MSALTCLLSNDQVAAFPSWRPSGTSGAAKVAIEKRLDRAKICEADDCRWALY